jgi:hypothetical protein
MSFFIIAETFAVGADVDVHSAAAMVVCELTAKFYDKLRDGEHIGYNAYQQTHIHGTSFKKANESCPWTFEKYLEMREGGSPVFYPMSARINREVFNEARDFIKYCADLNCRAAYHR